MGDEACSEGEFCNGAGVCQVRSGCASNADCTDAANSFCDLSTGKCLTGPAEVASAACGLASHCPFGTVCAGDVCTDGCNDDGDCRLGDVCSNNSCVSGAGLCSNDAFCGYGERCSANMCRRDRRGPYCRGCEQPSAQNPEPCDDPRNFCLNNNLEQGGFNQFCGVDCSLGQDCPNGYQCNGVTVLTRESCNTHAQCRCDPRRITFATGTCAIAQTCDPRLPNGQPDANAQLCVVRGHPGCGGGNAACLVAVGQTQGSCTCDDNSDCAGGATCVSGQCCTGQIREDIFCAGGENTTSGFCTCGTDDDCPRDSCDTSRGACRITGNPCTAGGGECGPIACVDGACLIGQNCAPLQGLACSDVGG